MDEKAYILEPIVVVKESPTKKRETISSESPASSEDATLKVAPNLSYSNLKDMHFIENELSPNKPSSYLPKFSGESFDVPRAEIPQCYHKKPAILRKVAKEGSNKDKLFYCCNQNYPQKRCRYFQWFAENSPPKPNPDVVVTSPIKAVEKSWLHYSSDEDSPDEPLTPRKLE